MLIILIVLIHEILQLFYKLSLIVMNKLLKKQSKEIVYEHVNKRIRI